jgi:hypothetical protein
MINKNEQTLVVYKIKATSIYKLVFCGLIFTFIPFGFICAILANFGFDTVYWNRQPIHGGQAIIYGPLIAMCSALFFTAFFGTFISLGLWLFSCFRNISIRIIMTPLSEGQLNTYFQHTVYDAGSH